MKVSLELRFQVSERAVGRCEYCLIHEEDAAFAHEVDHVISRQHGGRTDKDNLAYACMPCNRFKGTNLSSTDASGAVLGLFNPRIDQWNVHFRLNGSVIEPDTGAGAATSKLLRFNARERVIERSLLQSLGRYPRG